MVIHALNALELLALQVGFVSAKLSFGLLLLLLEGLQPFHLLLITEWLEKIHATGLKGSEFVLEVSRREKEDGNSDVGRGRVEVAEGRFDAENFGTGKTWNVHGRAGDGTDEK